MLIQLTIFIASVQIHKTCQADILIKKPLPWYHGRDFSAARTCNQPLCIFINEICSIQADIYSLWIRFLQWVLARFQLREWKEVCSSSTPETCPSPRVLWLDLTATFPCTYNQVVLILQTTPMSNRVFIRIRQSFQFIWWYFVRWKDNSHYKFSKY